ncbi:hypothetical protein GEMRC1_009866 [Eukaryota sp. GEM-RC1]
MTHRTISAFTVPTDGSTDLIETNMQVPPTVDDPAPTTSPAIDVDDSPSHQVVPFVRRNAFKFFFTFSHCQLTREVLQANIEKAFTNQKTNQLNVSALFVALERHQTGDWQNWIGTLMS